VAPAPQATTASRLGQIAADNRELSLATVIVVLGALVTIQAPQLLSTSNLVTVTVLASIIGVAAVGQSLVIITRNIDLSVESTIGLVAYVVADLLASKVLDAPAAMAFGVGLGLVLGMVNGTLVAFLGVPSIVATLGTLSIYRGIDFLLAGGKQVTVGDLPPGYTELARQTVLGVPIFVSVALVSSSSPRWSSARPASGARLCRRQQPRGGDDPGIRPASSSLAVFSVCGLLAGLVRVMGHRVRHHQRHRRLRRLAPGHRQLCRRRRQHLRRLGDPGRGRPGRALPRVHLERPDPAPPVPVLAPGHLRCRDPRRRVARRPPAAAPPATGRRSRRWLSRPCAPSRARSTDWRACCAGSRCSR
jgi:ribose/xylose/arabinose/galactoside ABC-type transport system permease subunit